MPDPTPLKPVESAEMTNLKAKEKMLADKLAGHDKADANHYKREGFDINEIKRRTQTQLAEVRKAIADLSK